jgi:hypothetical protein
LILNDDLKFGSMLPYILEGKKRGYDVIITNGNDCQQKRVWVRRNENENSQEKLCDRCSL